MKKLKIYAAGFDLFAPDGQQRCKRIADLCAQYGFEAFVPGYFPDGPGEGEPPTAYEIFLEDVREIDECDIVMANLNPYRGHEPDGGTAWEVGYAYARGKQLYAYIEDGRPMTEILGGKVDADGFSVEDFGSPLNLMLSQSTKVVTGGVQDCLKLIATENPTTE